MEQRIAGYIKKIQKLPSHVTKLSIWDIDDTLLSSKDIRDLKIVVYKNGMVHRLLSTSEYNEFVRRPPNGEYLIDPPTKEGDSFQNFRKAELIFRAKALTGNLRIAKRALESRDTMFMTLSARSKMDDKTKFLNAMKLFGLDLNKKTTHAVFAGEVTREAKIDTAEAKATIIQSALVAGNFNEVYMYDDHKPNLDAFLNIKKHMFKDPKFSRRIDFYAFHATHSGKLIPYSISR